MSIRIREMAYHKIKINKILSRITGKPEEQVGYQMEPHYLNILLVYVALQYDTYFSPFHFILYAD